MSRTVQRPGTGQHDPFAEALHADLLDLSYDAIVIRRIDGTICSWSAGATRLYGWTREEALGASRQDLVGAPSDAELLEIDQALSTHGLWEGRLTQRHRDGAVVFVKARWARRVDADGAVVICEIARDITEKVRAQAAEAAVGRQLALLTEHGALAAAYIDAGHCYRWVTQAYAQRYGLPQSAFPGRRVADVAGEEAYAVFMPFAEQALRGASGACEIEVPYARLPHQVVQVTYGPDLGADGQIEGMVVALTNISARREAEARAVSLEQRLEFLVDACDIGTWYCDLLPDSAAVRDDEGRPFGVETGALIWSDACRRHFGLAAGAPVDASVTRSRVFEEDQASVAAAIADAIAGRRDYDVTFRTWTSHGDGLRWVRGIGRVTRDVEGRPVRFDGITLDVTPQKRLEHVLRERESWFRELADEVPVALWLSDPAHGCTYVSRQWCEYTGTTLASNLGAGWLAHVHPDDRAVIAAAFARAVTSHEAFAFDYRLRRHDGMYRWMADLGQPRFSETGINEGFVGCAIDVHDRKVAEQALLDDDRRKDEFLAMLAHELRNPLAPMRTAVHLLQHQAVTPEASRRALPMLQRQVLHLVRLVDDLLDVTRIRTGKLALRRAPTTLQEVVTLAVEASGIEANGGPTLAITLPPTPVVVDGDGTRLVQAVVNLLNNAAKFTPRDGHVTLDVTSETAAGEVSIVVRDTGIGMEAALLPRVFDLFVQAGEPRDQDRSGLGIGLTLVRSLVEMHGGRVSAASDGPGQGSAITIVLPVQPAPVANATS